jgi:hypothetical protein
VIEAVLPALVASHGPDELSDRFAFNQAELDPLHSLVESLLEAALIVQRLFQPPLNQKGVRS